MLFFTFKYNPPSKIDSIQESEFLGQIQAVTRDKKSWNITHHLNSQPFLFKLDTRADVTIIPEDSDWFCFVFYLQNECPRASASLKGTNKLEQ